MQHLPKRGRPHFRSTALLIAAGAVGFAGWIVAQKPAPANSPKAEQVGILQPRFQNFLSQFKQAVRSNNAAKIADSIHFPLSVFSSSYSRAQFLQDRSETINFFTPSVRSQIAKSTPKDFIVYQSKRDVERVQVEAPCLPGNSPVYELDIINDRGGPALRMMFAETDSGYRLFCLTQ